MAAAVSVPAAESPILPLSDLKRILVPVVSRAITAVYDEVVDDALILANLLDPKDAQKNTKEIPPDLGFTCFFLTKLLKAKPKPADAASALAAQVEAQLPALRDTLMKVTFSPGYVNFFASIEYLSNVINRINSGEFLQKLSSEGKLRIMIEYSQPNTHKAFHVGHMRNAALGDCLVRVAEQMGHPVVAANYFGDEGAHIAKCLWYLLRQKHDLDTIEPAARAEFLGDMYTKAYESLSLDTVTLLPFPGVVAVKVQNIEPHPNAAAPGNWRVVTVEYPVGTPVTVVCGGSGYVVGDMVAYMPVGGSIGDKAVIPKDMMGVTSNGVMLARRELPIDQSFDADAKLRVLAAIKLLLEDDPRIQQLRDIAATLQPFLMPSSAGPAPLPSASAAAPEAAAEPAASGKDKKKAKAVKDDPAAQWGNNIAILPSTLWAGRELKAGDVLTDAGAFFDYGRSAVEEIAARKKEVSQVLKDMEHGEPAMKALWEKTKVWSLDEFRRIYKWLNCRFDIEFFESEVSEPSKTLVQSYIDQGKVFENSGGAWGAKLDQYGLGFAMVLKSDGTGLYLTKDLSLATVKFDKYKIDKSIYVVDMAQSHHFKQVFKVLELMGYENAKLCFHLAYGTVVLPDGKMSSRKGNVVLFSALKDRLRRRLITAYLEKHRRENGWKDEEVENAAHRVSVATIRYGMLNHDAAKDVVFDLDEWTGTQKSQPAQAGEAAVDAAAAGQVQPEFKPVSGNSGPYLMYAYARIKSILREVAPAPDGVVDLALLNDIPSRAICLHLNHYWAYIRSVLESYNPSTLCDFAFTLSQKLNMWYNSHNCKKEENPHLRNTRLYFIKAVAAVISHSLGLLGIETVERM